MTLKIVFFASLISFILGTFMGVLSCERLKIPILSNLINLITFVLRAIPFFVQLLLVYFVLPDLIGINLSVLSSSYLALGLCSSGYVCQIVRAGINSISVTQWEAAFSLGYNMRHTLFYVIIPQMFRNVLPAFNNEFESILKSTAICSSIGLLELTRIGMNIVSRESQDPLIIYLLVAAFYLALSLVINIGAKFLERKLYYKVRS